MEKKLTFCDKGEKREELFFVLELRQKKLTFAKADF